MRILLDTTYLDRLMEAPGALSDTDRRFFSARKVQIFVSVLSILEMRLKHDARHASGARKSRFDPKDVSSFSRRRM